jgi:hypothetical protein
MLNYPVPEKAGTDMSGWDKKYCIFDLHGDIKVAQSQLDELLKQGWEVVCSLGSERIILRNFDDDNNVMTVYP